jgi:hypothetical protein
MACGGASKSVAVYGDDGYVSVVLMMAMPTLRRAVSGTTYGRAASH